MSGLQSSHSCFSSAAPALSSAEPEDLDSGGLFTTLSRLNRREILEYCSGPFQLKAYIHLGQLGQSVAKYNRPTGHVYPFWVGELPPRTSQREESPAQRLKDQVLGFEYYVL